MIVLHPFERWHFLSLFFLSLSSSPPPPSPLPLFSSLFLSPSPPLSHPLPLSAPFRAFISLFIFLRSGIIGLYFVHTLIRC